VTTPAVPTLLELRGVTKVYAMGQTEVHALRGIDLAIAPGEMIAILGASGSGKSTLMNVIGCLDSPTSGTFIFDGTPVGGLSRNALADLRNAKLGFVFQGFNLLARSSALENVELPLLYDRSGTHRDVRRLATEALVRVGLGDRIHHLPSELSGGEQQRVAIARALVTRPKLVLADEPTGNLDSQAALAILALLQELNAQGVTIVLVTHERDFAMYARRTIEMRDGRIVRDTLVQGRRDAAADMAAAARDAVHDAVHDAASDAVRDPARDAPQDKPATAPLQQAGAE
jgi:putative ABC transport system ATP-binding protein